MKTFTSTTAQQPANVTAEGLATQAPDSFLPNEVRALDDWELTLVGGGEDVVCW